MSERENVTCRVKVSIVKRTALHAPPFSYSKTDRDVNAALNILRLGHQSLILK